MIKSGFAFVATHIEVAGSLPISLGDCISFRAATDAEIILIKEHLGRVAPAFYNSVPFYEGAWLESPTEGGGRKYEPTPLPRECWKYWVIAFDGSNSRVHDLEPLLRMLPVSVEYAFTVFFDQPAQQGTAAGWGVGMVNPLQMRRVDASPHPQRLDAESIARVPAFERQLAAVPEDCGFVKAALKSFNDLSCIPDASDLMIVGLFAIIESLVTHEPRKAETLDSIIHQIKNKMILLRKRYFTCVPLSDYFEPISEEAAWSKLYEYRSSVAHGSQFNFAKHSALMSRDNVILFLRSNVKQLLLMALADPEYFADLRRC